MFREVRLMRTMLVWCGAACVAALAASAPAGAQNGAGQANPAGAPVTISACSGGVTSIEFVETATYDVTMRNTAPVAADEIRLSVRYGRHEKRATFDLKEVFPPGVTVSRHLRRTVNGGLFSYWSDRNDCFVDYVHFTNGTSWTRRSSVTSAEVDDPMTRGKRPRALA